MSQLVTQIMAELQSLGDPERAKHSQRFFKTGPGEYGAGDVFLGIRVPVQRAVARRYRKVTLTEILELLQSPYHEARLTALFLLVDLYKRGAVDLKTAIYQAYSGNVSRINNWDLVDSSAPHIVGHFLFDKSREPLLVLARSTDLWQRRIAIIATQYFIRHYEFEATLQLAEILLHDPEDLIHKAVGWMLREVANRSQPRAEEFLRLHYQEMPRTMLRYAIEKFQENLRQAYLKGEIQP